MRKTGNTFRLVLRALLHASENDGAGVLLVFSGPNARDHAFLMVRCMIPINLEDFISVIYQAREIRFQNKSVIKFATAEYVETQRWVARRWSKFEEDNSLEDFTRSDKYRSLCTKLKNIVERNGGSTHDRQ